MNKPHLYRFLRAYLLFILLLLSSIELQAQKKGFVSGNIFQTNCFIENNGQFNYFAKHIEKIDFALHNNNDEVYFNATSFQFHLLEQKWVKKKKKEDKLAKEEKKKLKVVSEDWFKFSWVGGNPNANIKRTGKTSHYFTYGAEKYLSYGYQSITYQNVYPGIDIEYKVSPKRGIQYLLYLSPGADLSKVKFNYTANRSIETTIEKDKIVIENKTGKLVESGLKAFYKNGDPISIEYKKNGNAIQFKSLEQIDEKLAFIIDPWVTATTVLTGTNPATHAFDVDYDLQGNTLVIGGGGASNSTMLAPKVAKYDITGNLTWVFSGIVISPYWNASPNGNCGNFVVDKLSSKIYISQAVNINGSEIIRLTTGGIYDNFTSQANSQFREVWEMKFYCNTGDILACGGGTNSNINFGLIDTTSGITTTSNITALPGTNQDIACVSLDINGEIYAIFASPVILIDNKIYKVNQNFTASQWNTPTSFNTLVEANNRPNTGSSGNGINCLDVNSSYVYYYDGENLKAFDKSNGSPVGNTFNNGLFPKYQYGIYANDCNEIYVGMNNGKLHKYFFNGTNFSLQDSLIIPGHPNASVYDIVYNPITNQLMVSGEDFVANLNPQSTCSPGNGSGNINLTYNIFCPDSATVTVTNASPGDSYTFTWIDSNTNTTLGYSAPGVGVFTNGISGIIIGNTIQITVTKASACQYISKDTSFINTCNVDSSIYRTTCPGDTIHFGSLITSTPGVYIDTFLNTSNLDSVVALYFSNYPTYNQTIDTFICQGQTYTLPNNTITTVPVTDTFYFMTVNGCDSIIIVNLLVHPVHNFTLYDTICNNNNFILPNGMPVTQSGTYQSNFLSQFGCDSNYTNHVFFIPSPAITEDVTICFNTSYTLPNGNAVNTTGTYFSIFTAANGCDSIITTNLIVLNQNIVDVPATICATDFYTFPDNTISNIAGIYFDTLISNNGCDSIIRTDLQVIEIPELNLGMDTIICPNKPITLNAFLNDATSYLWNDLSNQPTKVVTDIGTYYVEVAIPPCPSVSDTINIKSCECEVFIPNAFSPNGDDNNDNFKPTLNCDISSERYTFSVYNRWGQCVFITNDANIGWNGSFKNKPQSLDTYFYIIRIKSLANDTWENYQGDVTLIR